MKILRIIARLNIGGPVRNAVLLTEGFSTRPSASLEHYYSSSESAAGGRVEKIKYETVLVCGEVAKSEGDMMYLAREKGIEPIIVKELGRELSWKDDWSAFWKIYKIIRQAKPDIIHTHTAKAGALGRFAGILYGKAILIHTFHGHVFSGYFGKVKTLFFIWVERFLALFTDKIITVSENLKKELAEKFKIAPERKIEVIELGFELGELLKLPCRDRSRPVPTNIGIIGRLTPIKNHKMVLDCARGLKQYVRSNSIGERAFCSRNVRSNSIGERAFCSRNVRSDNISQYSSSDHGSLIREQSREVRIIIIGDGEIREELERYTASLGIGDMVEFRGWMKDLKEIYEGLDIVVLTSLNEGTPVSLIEAMAAGKPVVAAKVGGVQDIVQDEKSGYLVGSGDIEGFSRKLEDLIKDPEKRKRFGEYGRSMVKDRFSKERLIKDTEKLYNNTLQKNKNN